MRNLDILEAAVRFCTALDCVTVTADCAVAHCNPFAGSVGGALETDAVIIRINLAVLNQHIVTAIDINPVIVFVTVIPSRVTFLLFNWYNARKCLL